MLRAFSLILFLILSLALPVVAPAQIAKVKLSRDVSALETEFETLLKAAKDGNPEAQNNVGLAYDEGHGVAIDDVEAAIWYRRAADQGLAMAQYNLGLMYIDGEGVTQNYLEAAHLFALAADQESAPAQNMLGQVFERGWGVERDL